MNSRYESDSTGPGSEGRLGFVLEAARVGDWYLNLKTGRVQSSPVHDRIFGYEEPVVEWSLEDLLEQHVHPEDRRAVEGVLVRSPGTQEDSEVECRIVRIDGEERWARMRTRVFRGSDGEVEGLLGLTEDITEKRTLEKSLVESETRYRKLLEIGTVGIIFFDSQGELFDANDAFLEMGRYSREDVEQRRLSWHKLTPPEWMPASRRAIDQLKTMGSTTPYEKEYYRKDGSRWWGLFAAKGLSEDAGVEFILDISDQKRLADELQEAHDQLERRVEDRTADLVALNEELETFNYSVSHDLRAPLRGIDGFSQVLLEDYSDILDERARSYLARIRSGAKRMGDLIDDLLNLSSLSKPRLKRERVDVSALARQVTQSLQDAEPERDVEIEIADSVVADADERFLKIVLDNLLGNAWKFTSRREGARIEFRVEESDEGPVYVVCDNGAGFDSRYGSKLFTPFQRLHSPSEFEGTGIGLAIVRRIVRRHGGQVWATGQVGKGAEFRFTLG